MAMFKIFGKSRLIHTHNNGAGVQQCFS